MEKEWTGKTLKKKWISGENSLVQDSTTGFKGHCRLY